MRHAYRCHVSPDSLSDARHNGERRRLDAGDVLDTARCPCCGTPLVARMGRGGPYFHCGCVEKVGSCIARDGNSTMSADTT